jgi:Fe2+ or Zn2+ uptake regulation protein
MKKTKAPDPGRCTINTMSKIDRRKYNRHVDSWTVFRSHLIKRTPARKLIFDIIQKTDRPFCAKSLFLVVKSMEKMSGKRKPVALASIYRTLHILEKIKFIQRAESAHAKSTIYYEI